MFTQVDRANRRTQGGLGIGLTLVRSLVQMHGGTVSAHSNGPGTGTEFVVSLRVASAAVGTARYADAGSGRLSQRILVVDDNRDAGEMLGAVLERLGATVAVAYNGREALAIIDEFSPGAVLLDIGM